MDQPKPDDLGDSDGTREEAVREAVEAFIIAGEKRPEVIDCMCEMGSDEARAFNHPDGSSPPILARNFRDIAFKLQRIKPGSYFHSLSYPLDDDRDWAICPSREECERVLAGIESHSEALVQDAEEHIREMFGEDSLMEETVNSFANFLLATKEWLESALATSFTELSCSTLDIDDRPEVLRIGLFKFIGMDSPEA